MHFLYICMLFLTSRFIFSPGAGCGCKIAPAESLLSCFGNYKHFKIFYR